MIFQQPSDNVCTEYACDLWQSFKMFELTIVMRQAEDLTFANLLNRVRVGKHTSEDVELLKSRVIPDLVSDTSRLRICHTCRRVEDYNTAVIDKINNQPVYVDALDNISLDFPLEQSAIDHIKTKVKNKPSRETSNLDKILPLVVGTRVLITVNVDQTDGISNGVLGVLKNFLTANSQVTILWI